jgi:hypothetical protein
MTSLVAWITTAELLSLVYGEASFPYVIQMLCTAQCIWSRICR